MYIFRDLLIASDKPSPLKVRHVPLPLTCGVFDGTIVTDPSLLEEELVTTQVTVVSTADGKVGERCHVSDLVSPLRLVE